MALTKEQHEAIQGDGSRARAQRRGVLDNPYLKSENMPAATGETHAEWNEKYLAWELGWTAEHAMQRD